jgi:uncharacterized protein
MSAPRPDPHLRVLHYLRALEPPGGVVAISGGVDSAVMLSLAVEAWGPERTLAATSSSESLPPAELADAERLTNAAGVEHVVLVGAELEVEGFRQNGPDRCFHCKDHLYGRLQALAGERGLAHVLDGTNADDVGDHRPGMQAARQHGVLSPLMEVGVGKDEIREIARARGLEAWAKPAEACLSSRFPYGTEVTAEGLGRVERAERALKAFGFPVVRVRVHDPIARLEVPAADMARLLDPPMRARVVQAVQDAGFAYVALDLQGFRSGSLNETLAGGFATS